MAIRWPGSATGWTVARLFVELPVHGAFLVTSATGVAAEEQGLAGRRAGAWREELAECGAAECGAAECAAWERVLRRAFVGHAALTNRERKPIQLATEATNARGRRVCMSERNRRTNCTPNGSRRPNPIRVCASTIRNRPKRSDQPSRPPPTIARPSVSSCELGSCWCGVLLPLSLVDSPCVVSLQL